MLRQLVLRPHLAPEENVYPGDDEESSIHMGIFLDTRLVAIGSAGMVTDAWARQLVQLDKCNLS